MRYPQFLVIVLSIAKIEALRLPIRTEQPKSSNLIQRRSNQFPLQDSPNDHRSPLNASSTYTLLTPLTLGTPPQTFKTTLSLLTTDLFVLSSQNKAPDFHPNTHYNSSLSSTYQPNGTAISVFQPSVAATGFVSRDDVRIGGVKVKDWNFGEAVELEYERVIPPWEYERGIPPWDLEAFLGLGLSTSSSDLGTRNLVSEMYDGELIGEETFSVTYPRLAGEVGEEEGSLVFGESTEGVKMLDVVDEKLHFLGDDYAAWGVPVKGARLGNGKNVSSGPMKHTIAWVHSENTWIELPGTMAEEMHKFLKAHHFGWDPTYVVRCETRASLPDLVFEMAEEGVEVRISAFDYTVNVIDDDDNFCMSMLAEGQDDRIMLGAGFLRGVKSYFDVGAGKIGFEKIDRNS